jgi:hypothetical protein
MNGAYYRGTAAGLITALVFGIIVLSRVPGAADSAGQAEGQPPKPRAAGQAVAMPANLVGLEIELGRKDKQPGNWEGEIQVSEGRVLEVRIARGGPKARAEGNRFFSRSIRPQPKKSDDVVGPILSVSLDAPPSAKVTVKTGPGTFSFDLKDLSRDGSNSFLDGAAAVEWQEGAVRLTGRETEDDFPVLAKGPQGEIWLAYVEYRPGRPYVRERILAGSFEELVPSGNGDQVLLTRLEGRSWQPPLEVTGPGLDVHRPAVAVDGQGRVCVAWGQQVDGDWEIFYRHYAPAQRQWSEIVRLTRSPGADFHVVAATDSAGTVWLAWQAWRQDHFVILAAALDDKQPAAAPRVVSASKANSWSPAIAVDSKGNVYVAYDTYDKGNYDVRLHRLGEREEDLAVADSAHFEARPSVACDAQDRVWVAYEEGDEQWGKDYATPQFKRIPLEKNPGFALYVNRTVRVKCLADGKLLQPAAALEDAPRAKPARKKSVPRLALDAAGGLWLLYRQHPRVGLAAGGGGGGEVWESFAVRYDGRRWSAPRRLAASANLIDNRPALLPWGPNVLAVYSGDGRMRTQNRQQDDLFAAVLQPAGPAAPPELVAAPPTLAAAVPVVHPEEAADVARLRDYRLEAGGKRYQLLRGEFHRHTEFSSHGDIDGLLEDSWRYALDAGNLDWMGNGDHDNGFHHEYMWWLIQKTTDLFQHAPRFVAAYTYERSVVYPNGHRNVILPRRGIRPLPRGELPGTAENGSHDTKLLYRYLKHFGGICASHTSGTDMGTDWRDNDPTLEPVVEIYQGHRHNYEHAGAPRSATQDTQIGGYRPAGYVWNAFEKGYRFGFESSSDHVSTHMSYGVLLAEEVSRQGIIDAFKKRHCYAATDNILLIVRAGEHLMGDAFETAQRPTLTIHVHGTAPVAKLHIIKDNKYVYSTQPNTPGVKELRYTDMEAKAGATSYYYVRIEQADGNLAWGSPMWITYKP